MRSAILAWLLLLLAACARAPRLLLEQVRGRAQSKGSRPLEPSDPVHAEATPMTDMSMPDPLALLQRLIETYPDRTWTVREIARVAGLSLIDAQTAVEWLAEEGTLVHRGGGYYARPFGMDLPDV